MSLLTVPLATRNRVIGEPIYRTPHPSILMAQEFDMNVYDLAGRDLNDATLLKELRSRFEEDGRLHITGNDRYQDGLPQAVIDALKFGDNDRFAWGGMNSGRTIRPHLGGGVHAVDTYPSHMTLLPHNEILYQRQIPRSLLFHYRAVGGSGNGGRTLVHSSQRAEQLIHSAGDVGEALLLKLKQHGQMLRTGFLDASHPEKERNYIRSWQDRFGTESIDEALSIAQSQTDQFDKVWIETLPEFNLLGGATFMLMTEITVPMFNLDSDGQMYMMFPRISYDEPALINGMRSYPLGNGDHFSADEIDILLNAYWQTREGVYQRPGDILLVDNLRYGHSREPYKLQDAQGNPFDRVVGVVMAGNYTVGNIRTEGAG